MPAVRLKMEVRMEAGVTSVRATEISMTPATEIAMAARVPPLTLSPTKISANNAACAGSVRE